MTDARSWLFIPGDSDRKLDKADDAAADALILDLEDAVALERKPEARLKVREFLLARTGGTRRSELWVRINPLEDAALDDLLAVMAGRPDGIVVPKIEGVADIKRLGYYLDVLEAQEALVPGATRILPVATETPLGALHVGDFARSRIADMQCS